MNITKLRNVVGKAAQLPKTNDVTFGFVFIEGL
jgi:hypothetical protein